VNSVGLPYFIVLVPGTLALTLALCFLWSGLKGQPLLAAIVASGIGGFLGTVALYVEMFFAARGDFYLGLILVPVALVQSVVIALVPALILGLLIKGLTPPPAGEEPQE
jgi:hypothetical protein